MSGLALKPNITWTDRHVRFANCGSAPASFDHLVGAAQQRRRYGQAQRFRRPDIDDQLKFLCCLNRQVGRLDPAKNAIERTQPLVDDRTSFMVGAEPQGGELFDVVVCNEVLYVVPEADEMLAVAQRSLRPGGHLLTSIWSHPGDRALQRLIANRFDLRDAVDVENVVRPRKSRVACWQRRA